MRFQVRGLIRDEAVAERMALVEGIVGELLNNIEQFDAHLPVVTGPDHTFFEAIAGCLHDRADLLTHCLSEVVGFGE